MPDKLFELGDVSSQPPTGFTLSDADLRFSDLHALPLTCRGKTRNYISMLVFLKRKIL